jgi:hypothetical protein
VDLSFNKLKAMPGALAEAVGLLVLQLSHNQINATVERPLPADIFRNCR